MTKAAFSKKQLSGNFQHIEILTIKMHLYTCFSKMNNSNSG